MQSMTVPVMPEIAEKHGTSQSTVTWVLTAYLLSASVFTPIAGRLGDIYGKKRLLVLSLGTLTFGSFLAALAPNIGVLILARVILGAGGGILPLAFGIIRDEFPPAKVGNAVSIVSSLTAVGFGAGVVIAGPIMDGLGYAWLFWLPFIVSGLTCLAAIVLVPESPERTPGRVAFTPAILLSAWLICLLLGLSQAPQWGWLSAKVIGLLIAAVVLIVVWIKVELTVDVPLIDMKMMRLPGVWTSNVVALMVGVGLYASLGFLPQLIQTPSESGYGFGASVTASGLILLPSAFVSFAGGLLATPIVMRIGAKVAVVIATIISAAGMVMLALLHDEAWQVGVANCLTGFGIGVAFACLARLIVAAVRPDQTGVATGMNANIRTIGGAIGTAVMASIVTSHYLPNGYPEQIGYTAGFLVLAGALVIAAGAAMLIPDAAVDEAELAEGPDQTVSVEA
jgi:EmrB/QacA subfamily drug resistance transporter